MKDTYGTVVIHRLLMFVLPKKKVGAKQKQKQKGLKYAIQRGEMISSRILSTYVNAGVAHAAV